MNIYGKRCKAYGTPNQADFPEIKVHQSPDFSMAGTGLILPGHCLRKKGCVMVGFYITLFACYVTRAFHLDLVSNFSVP